MWECICFCGETKHVLSQDLNAGRVKSCGCLRKEKAPINGRTQLVHGQARSSNRRATKEYNAWSGLKARCLCETDHHYPNYGGRGITVCARWVESFENFYEDMGPAPSPSHSIDRIDVNGPYSPENCRWTTWKVQHRNKTTNRMVEFMGKTQSVADWSEELGIPSQRIFSRLAKGWSVDRTLTEPVHENKRNHQRHTQP